MKDATFKIIVIGLLMLLTGGMIGLGYSLYYTDEEYLELEDATFIDPDAIGYSMHEYTYDEYSKIEGVSIQSTQEVKERLIKEGYALEDEEEGYVFLVKEEECSVDLELDQMLCNEHSIEADDGLKIIKKIVATYREDE